VSKFIKECRREWKRLGVPDAVANEMTADLKADLEEAEAEGASREDVLGSAVFDPRSFAASWAAERGVAESPATRERLPGRSLAIAAIAALLIAVIGVGLAMLASRSGAGVVAVHPAALLPRPQAGAAPGLAVHGRAPGIHVVGRILLTVGILGLLSTLLWSLLWPNPSRLLRQRASMR
jgi:hypothetical protein